MKIRHLVIPVALVFASCSGSDAASDTTDAPSTDSTDVTTPSAPATETVSTDAPAETTPDTETESTESESSVPPATDAPPATGGFVIDGPARVRPSCDSLARGVSNFALEAGGAEYDVRIFVPTTAVSDPAPVVLNWHGIGSNGTEQAEYTGYETLAEQEGFIVVHPTGVPFGGDDGFSFWELTALDSPDRDDLAFADALIDTVVADWCADPDRVYSTGMSNGGLFTSELVCGRADRIAAAVSVAGITHPDGCEPTRPVPYLAFHGTDDDAISYTGTGESTILDVLFPNGILGQAMPDEFAEFAADAGCDPDPVRTEETPEVISSAYGSCDDAVPMTFYEIVGGGHTWPDSPLADQLAGFGFFTDDISATADGWAFMSQFSL
jgi:polyhydroxybutyrate depolymerase